MVFAIFLYHIFMKMSAFLKIFCSYFVLTSFGKCAIIIVYGMLWLTKNEDLKYGIQVEMKES